MKVTVIPIVIGALGTILKGLLKRVEDLQIRVRVATIETKGLLTFLSFMAYQPLKVI